LAAELFFKFLIQRLQRMPMNKLLFLLCFISCSVFGQKVKLFKVLDLPNAKLSRHIQRKDTVYVLSATDFRDATHKTTFTLYEDHHDKLVNYLTKCVELFDAEGTSTVFGVDGGFVTIVKPTGVKSLNLYGRGNNMDAYTNLSKDDLINLLSKL